MPHRDSKHRDRQSNSFSFFFFIFHRLVSYTTNSTSFFIICIVIRLAAGCAAVMISISVTCIILKAAVFNTNTVIVSLTCYKHRNLQQWQTLTLSAMFADFCQNLDVSSIEQPQYNK